MKPQEINAHMVIPEDKEFVSVKAEEAAFLFDFIRKNQLTKTLETGLGFGRSAIHILAAHSQKHLAIDPFQSDYEYLALKNVETCGFKDKFEFIEDYSHNVLPQLVKEIDTNGKFDFIFIDGDHKFDGILVDFYYADLLLLQNGFIILHDSWMRSTQLVAEFIRKNKSNYTKIESPLRNFIIFQKTQKQDDRDGMHFREFYTNKSKLKYSLITWMISDGDSFLKRMAKKLKDAIK